MPPPPLISIVILNWNGKGQLSPCIQSVKRQTYPNLEILLVDNASTDCSIETIHHHFHDLRLILNPENLGYGGEIIEGFKRPRGNTSLS